MPTEVPAKTKQETWLDWLPEGAPEPELLSRDELLARLQVNGIEMTTSDLRYWEYVGVLPRPTRRWHQGATRALYPNFAVLMIEQARKLQDSRIPLEQIGAEIRGYGRVTVALLLGIDLATEEGRSQLRAALHPPIAAQPTQALIDEVRQLAENRERLTGIPVERIEIRLTDTRGRRVTYPIKVNPLDPVSRERVTQWLVDRLSNPHRLRVDRLSEST